MGSVGAQSGVREAALPPTATAPTPRLDLDLAAVRRAWRAMRTALPDVELRYAVKANPHPDVLALLVAEGASFDLAGLGELDACLLAGAAPARLSWGNPVKKVSDVRAARAAGV